jgi:hypothetical protein
MNSQTAGRVRSATVVTVTNRSGARRSSSRPASPSTSDRGTFRAKLTVVNSIPNPELTFDEGRAIVSSRLPEIGVSARVYYTSGERDEDLLSITDSGVVVFGTGNHGD